MAVDPIPINMGRGWLADIRGTMEILLTDEHFLGQKVFFFSGSYLEGSSSDKFL